MGVIITKQGIEENSFTWEYYCDTYEDLNSIEQENITIGSYCTLLQGENGVEIYAGDGNHQWVLISPSVGDKYAAEHDGKVILNGNLLLQSDRTINENGTYDTTLNNEINVLIEPRLQNKTVTSNGIITHDEDYYGLDQVIVNVPNSYEDEDEDKIVQNGELVEQTSRTITENGTYDTTINNEVIVITENVYEESDEGKVVKNGELIEQTSYSVDENGTYDTTTYNEVVVNGIEVEPLIIEESGTYTAPAGVAYTPVTVNIAQNLQNKTITENGTVVPDQGYDGLSSVVVNVSGGSGNRIIKSFENGTLVYVDDDDGPRIYFNGYTKESDDANFPTGCPIPRDLDYTKAYGSDKQTQIGQIGWYQEHIRSWSIDTAQLISGTFWGVCYFDEGQAQTHPYEEPPSAFVMVSKTVTENGTYDPADDNADAYSEIIVNVSGGDDPFALTDYIESNGTQYIDTGYLPTDDTKVEIVANVSSGSNSYPTMFGMRPQAYSPAGTHDFLIHFYSQTDSGTLFERNKAVAIVDHTKLASKKTEYKFGANWYSVKNDSYMRGESVQSLGSITGTYPLYIFNFNNMGTVYGADAACIMKLYRFRIYEGSTLMHEYIPWTDNNNVVCLKDTVTTDLLYNSGTGVFVKGSDT